MQAVIESSVRTLTDIWLGRKKFNHAVRARELTLTGQSAIVRQLPRWLRLSAFADVPQPHARKTA
ncbi:hypothetical protein D3C83_127710 [compost metagenome]